jgi:hypothetical protein
MVVPMQKKKMKARGRSFAAGHKLSQFGDEPLKKLLTFKLSEAQYNDLKQYCDRNNLKISALLRELVEDFLKTVPDP